MTGSTLYSIRFSYMLIKRMVQQGVYPGYSCRKELNAQTLHVHKYLIPYSRYAQDAMYSFCNIEIYTSMSRATLKGCLLLLEKDVYLLRCMSLYVCKY